MKNLSFAPIIIIIAALLVATSCTAPVAPAADGDGAMTYQMINSVMDYIKDKHPDAAPFMKDNVSWSNVSTDKRIGYTRSTYAGESWSVTIGHAATAEVVYDVRAQYKNEMIVWAGAMKDNAITEQSYTKK